MINEHFKLNNTPVTPKPTRRSISSWRMSRFDIASPFSLASPNSPSTTTTSSNPFYDRFLEAESPPVLMNLRQLFLDALKQLKALQELSAHDIQQRWLENGQELKSFIETISRLMHYTIRVDRQHAEKLTLIDSLDTLNDFLQL
mmetsp:Transcript_12012/g.17870  ORF Transcript_12012/g.17870 Transcript_12012/m.17870 type:complete len:144 (+) Transcript_12012:4513-4944(+)